MLERQDKLIFNKDFPIDNIEQSLLKCIFVDNNDLINQFRNQFDHLHFELSPNQHENKMDQSGNKKKSQKTKGPKPNK